MSDELGLQLARLIPTSGISGRVEQERRAASALLAVISAVRVFGTSLLKPFGASSGPIECFTEVPFELNGRKLRPDGLIRVTRAGASWTALVEIKTGRAELRREQVEDYLDIAAREKFDAVITISNQILADPDVHPVDVDGRKLKKVKLVHLSWTRILAEAVMQRDHRGIDDPEQAWILSELIHYLEHKNSGAHEFEDMGKGWTAVRNGVEAGTLRATDPGASAITYAWDQLVQYVALRLGQQLGVDVQPIRGKSSSVSTRSKVLAQEGVLEGAVRIPHAASPVSITADLRAKQIVIAVELRAPTSGRDTTRVNWLVRQLQDAPKSARIDAYAHHARATTSELLRDVREDPRILVHDSHGDIRRFRVSLNAAAGSKRGTGKGSFIDSVTNLVDDFYEQVVQNLRTWVDPAPKLRRGESQMDATTAG